MVLCENMTPLIIYLCGDSEEEVANGRRFTMVECNKASLLRCRNCKHVECDKYKIMQILIRIGALN